MSEQGNQYVDRIWATYDYDYDNDEELRRWSIAMEGGDKDWRKLYLRATPERLAAEGMLAALEEVTTRLGLALVMLPKDSPIRPLVLGACREADKALPAIAKVEGGK